MKELPNYINTAGKITVITSLIGVVVFTLIFLLNIGAKEFRHVEAQGLATTTVTVLNTPPQWTVDAQEETESSTSTPTNSSYQVAWVATATDSNGEDYYLLICDTSGAPTASSTGPTCPTGSTTWAVSALTLSGVQARAATTTTEVAPFLEENIWYAWVCDAILVNPRCNSVSKQGTATTSSPFNVNKRPDFTGFWNDSFLPKVPGATVTFHATSSDPDSDPVNDTVKLVVCSTNSFATSTDTCDAVTLSSSTLSASDPTAAYTVPIPYQDQDYPAWGFIIDNHGHESIGVAQGTMATMTVANAAPTVASGQIVLNGTSTIILTEEAGETTGFTLQYYVNDTNSCENASAGSEIVDYTVSVFRSGITAGTCDGSAGSYDANNCYPSGVATTTWNLVCTASSTSCSGASDQTEIWDCTFPLWYIADPTDGGATNTIYWAENWVAAVSAEDDDAATSTYTTSAGGKELESFMMLALSTPAIPYGQLEPGDRTDPLVATTTITATGNVGIDELLSGEAMCTYYTSAVSCNPSSTSTIAVNNQVYATSSVAFNTATTSGDILSASTTHFDINVYKSTATTTPASGITFWGINIPGTITLAGAYTGENTFYGAVSAPGQWGP